MNGLTMQVRWFVILVAFCLPTAAQAQIRITLNNKFIAEHMDKVLIDAKFVVVKAHARPNPAAADGDLHVAGTSDDIGLPTVAELMNAKFETMAMDKIHEVEGMNQPIQIKGVWRLWCEHAGGSNQVQGDPIKLPYKNANPDHIFEIHPITQVEKLDVLKSLKPIPGFTPKKAGLAFHRYDTTLCEIRPAATTTTIITKMVGFNYVKFKMALHEHEKPGGTEVIDGRFLNAEIIDPDDDEIVHRGVRVAFVKGSEPESFGRKLKQGETLTVLGIPRISLKEVKKRVDSKDKDALKLDLPYEIVVVGLYHDNGAQLRDKSDAARLARAPSRRPGFDRSPAFVPNGETPTVSVMR